MSITEFDKALSLVDLRTRALEVAEYMDARIPLRDGSLGYRVTAETVITVKAGTDLHDPNAPEETIRMVAKECEISIPDPVLTIDGALRFDIEISYLVADGVSTVLFGEEAPVRILVGRGVDPMIRPTLGRTEIPADVTFGKTPVSSAQQVYLVCETPLGRLHNREPALMTAKITSIPPVGTTFTQEGIVPLYNEAGAMVAMKSATASTITGLIK